MNDLEENISFNCPYCGSSMVVKIDLTGGQKQKFVYDCEVCCRPIAVTVEIDDEGIKNFNCEKES